MKPSKITLAVYVFALVSALMSGCAATYKQPTSTYLPLTAAIVAPKAELLRRAKQVLVVQGFQITNSDDAAGVISTAPRNFRITPDQADCGTTMGIDYLKDNRTDTKLGYGVLVSEGKVTISATIEAQYKPGAIDQNITLSCVSRGTLEADLLKHIQASTGA